MPTVVFWLQAVFSWLSAGCCPVLSAQTQPPEHKIGVFVLFWPSEPSFSGFPSTKSAFLCAFCLRNPHFRAFRAQNRGFCALFAFGTPVFGLFEHKIVVFVRFCPSGPPFSSLPSTKSAFLCSGRGKSGIGKRKVAFVQITAHANVPQTCLEQGFVCAVICRNCARDNQQHH